MISDLFSSHVEMQSWTIMQVEHRRIDVFRLWCWRRLLRVPWTSRRSNQSILKEINSLEGNGEEILKEIPHWRDWCWSLSSNTLATWCKKPSHWKRPWCWERLRAGEEGEKEDKIIGCHHWQWTGVWANSSRYWWTGKPGIVQSMRSERIRQNLATKQWQRLYVCLYWWAFPFAIFLFLVVVLCVCVCLEKFL